MHPPYHPASLTALLTSVSFLTYSKKSRRRPSGHDAPQAIHFVTYSSRQTIIRFASVGRHRRHCSEQEALTSRTREEDQCRPSVNRFILVLVASAAGMLFPDIDITDMEGGALRGVEMAIDHRQDAPGDRVEENVDVARPLQGPHKCTVNFGRGAS